MDLFIYKINLCVEFSELGDKWFDIKVVAPNPDKAIQVGERAYKKELKSNGYSAKEIKSVVSVDVVSCVTSGYIQNPKSKCSTIYEFYYCPSMIGQTYFFLADEIRDAMSMMRTLARKEDKVYDPTSLMKVGAVGGYYR